MRLAFRRARYLRLFAAALLLASCGEKQTGSDRESTEIPHVATPPPIATAEPQLAKVTLGFAGTDADGDGQISSSEYATSSTRLFGSMDADDDGALTVAELDVARTAMQIDTGPSSEKLIEQADSDGDAQLTLAEFVANTNRRFAAADTNADGQLSTDEYHAGHPEVRRPAPATPPPAEGTPTPPAQP